MVTSESARLLFEAEIPWTINFFILGPLAVVAAFIFYQLIVPGLLKWRRLKDDITVVLIQYANYVVYVEKVDGKKKFINDTLYERVNQELRKLAGEITTLRHVFLYKLWTRLGWLPHSKLVDDIRGDLIGWSNTLVQQEDSDIGRAVCIESLKKNLGMENLYEKVKELQELEWKNARNR